VGRSSTPIVALCQVIAIIKRRLNSEEELMSARLEGKVAVITGAASGIGRRTAELFAAEGAHVVLADRNDDLLEQVRVSLGDECLAVSVDVAMEDDVARMVAATVERFGRLDIGVNCAGLGTLSPIHLHPLSEWQRVLDVSLTGVLLSVKHQSHQMLEQGSGAIVNIASINGRQPAEGMVAYCTAKAGVEMLTKVAALELGPSGIRVNAISPGFVDTPMTAPAIGGIRDSYIDSIPLGRPGTADDIARAALFLAGDESSWVNGEVMVVDGGEVHREYPRLLTGSF
jgi:3-oxoacyl-[acyl-carrier protein] reductase